MSFAEYLALVVRRADAPAASRRPSTSSTASTTTAPDGEVPVGRGPPVQPVRRAVGQRRGSAVRPGDGPEPGLPGRCARFVQDGRPNKLILLHGPNGSAKSTFIRCLGRGLEHYSTLEEGALYRFCWIFPSAEEHARRHRVRRPSHRRPSSRPSSFAYLPDDAIDARLGDELRDHPLLLIPLDERQKLIDKLLGGTNVQRQRLPAPAARCRRRTARSTTRCSRATRATTSRCCATSAIERFEISHRYRTGWVTVEPQLSVDATRAPDHRGPHARARCRRRCSRSRCTSTAARSSARTAA